MRYPIILNGDHAEFEREHADTPLKERPDWPLPSFDAKDWAEHFLKINPNCGIDEGVIVTWFANALMRGYDERTALGSEEAAGIREAAQTDAYADVVRQGLAIYNDERNDIQDRRAIRRFIERFEDRASCPVAGRPIPRSDIGE